LRFFGVSNGLIGKAPFLEVKRVLKQFLLKQEIIKKSPQIWGLFLRLILL